MCHLISRKGGDPPMHFSQWILQHSGSPNPTSKVFSVPAKSCTICLTHPLPWVFTHSIALSPCPRITSLLSATQTQQVCSHLMDFTLAIPSVLNAITKLCVFLNAFFSLRSQLKLHLYRVASLPLHPSPTPRVRRRLSDFVFCIGYYEKILDAQRINILHLRSTNAECYFYVNDSDEQSTDSPSGASTWGEKCYLQEQYQMLDSECPALTFGSCQGRDGNLKAGKAKVAEQSSFRSDFTCGVNSWYNSRVWWGMEE